MINQLSPTTNQLFSLRLLSREKKSYIYMQLFTNQITTRYIKNVTSILQEYVPSIFASICYNDRNLPFGKEMKNTEIGHLYEHILLEFVAQLHHIYRGDQSDFCGTTSWNWQKTPRGTFKIEINVGKRDKEIMQKAMLMTNNVMDIVLAPLAEEVVVNRLPAPQPAFAIVRS